MTSTILTIKTGTPLEVIEKIVLFEYYLKMFPV